MARNAKQYEFNGIKYTFSASLRKWVFETGTGHDLITEAKGGVETATKISKAISGAIKRRGYIDSLARFQIFSQILSVVTFYTIVI